MTYEAIYAPVSGFLVFLADGWTLPFVVEPMHGHHGEYSILLTRGDFSVERADHGVV